MAGRFNRACKLVKHLDGLRHGTRTGYATLGTPVLLGVAGGVADRVGLCFEGVGVGARDLVPLAVALLERVTLAGIDVDAFPVCDDVTDEVGAREGVVVCDPVCVGVDVGDGFTRMPATYKLSITFAGALVVWVEVTLASRTHIALNGDHA